jgi:hypothetical protein
MNRSKRRQVVIDIAKLEKIEAKLERRIDDLKRELVSAKTILSTARQELALKEVKPDSKLSSSVAEY